MLISRHNRLQLVLHNNHGVRHVITSLMPRRAYRVGVFRQYGVIHMSVSTTRVSTCEHTTPHNLSSTSQRIEVLHTRLGHRLLHRMT